MVTEYNKRLLTMIKNSRRLAAYDPLLGPYFADKLKTILIIRDFSEEQKKEEARYKQHLTDELKKKYPVRSKIKSWLAHHTKVQLQAYIDKQKHGSLAFVTVYPIAGINHEELIKKLVDEGLIEQAYLINKSVEFIPQAVALMKKLDKEKVPLKYFEFEARIWNPKHWTVTTLIKKGKSEKIIERYEKIKTNTGHFGWRFSNMWARTQKFFKDGIYLIAITNLWNGPLSLQALFTKQQFYPHYTLKDGLVEYNIDRPVQSYLSLLRSIKDRIKKARDDFENSVEGTFVDRDIIRPFHIVWTYLKYYSLGLAVLTLFPPAVIVNFLLSTSLILSSPLWSPLLAFSIYLTSVTVYDFDAIESHAQNLGLPIMKPLIYTFAMGIGQILLSFVGVLLYHPVMCLWLCNWAFWRKNLKSISDFLVFYVFIKRYVRVPAKNSLLAERIAGPGLESTFLYKIPVELSLLLLQEHIEKFEIKQYKEMLIEKIDEPEAKYRKVHFELFSHFGTTLGSHPNLERILDDEESLQRSIDESIKAQEEKNPVRGIELPSNVRLSAKDLPKMLHFSKHLVEEFFTERVFKLMSEKQIAQFWEDYGLEKNDWENLTIEFIEEIFTEAFLEPLKEGDVVYELDNRKEEVEMLAKQIFKGIPELENYTSAREHAVVPTVKSRYQNLHVENGLYPPRLPSSISPWIISKKK
uniref:Uncharacterized protein n=1 Tax=Arcella intermedia TaxID=1963864 RepID=A0A6B2KZ02_9EUKA